MSRLLCTCVVGCVGFALSGIGPVGAQAQGPRSFVAQYTEPIALFSTGLGSFTRPISSTNSEAQAYFDQGFQMMYAFAKREAVRSFREAWKRDANCAICHWGEAWAWGSFLNAPMNELEAPYAYAAIQTAMALRHAHASPVERDLIEATSVRYVERFDASRRVEQDRAYADALARLASRYPDDLEIAVLHGEALFLLEPRRGFRDASSPAVQHLHHVLEGVLAKDIHHPGACHLYVHATESTVVPERAADCAAFLGQSIPGASHINHMPSHTWNEIGRWGDSVRANIEAWHSDLKAAVGEGFAIYPEHNLHMLLYAASMDGQGAIAIQAAKDYARLTNDAFYHVLTLTRFGRFEDVLEVTRRPRSEVTAGLFDFAHGYAQLRLGKVEEARTLLAAVQKAAETTTQGFRFHSGKDLLTVVARILDGEIRRMSGDLDGAISLLERAVTTEDALTYDEPEPFPFAARHWLGAALLEAKRFGDAERVYRDELLDHPHNGWSLIGLRQALAGQGRTDADVDRDFAASWARSDTWIRSSRF